MHRIPLLLLICCLPLLASAQDSGFRTKGYVWPESTPAALEVAETFADAPAVVLQEKNKVIVYGSRTPLMYILFKKNVRIRYQSEEGIAQHGQLTIPESVDPIFDYHDVPLADRQEKHRPQYYNLKIEHFAARIIKPDGRVIPADYVMNMGEERQLFDMIFHRSFFYAFDFKDLEPGDELEIDYAWEIPYDVNWYKFNGWRLFMHGDLPKQDYQLTALNPRRLVNTFKGVEPDTSWRERSVSYRRWEAHNLPGNIAEVGARPHLELPFITLTLNADNMAYNYIDPVTGLVVNNPYWTTVLRWRERRGPWLKRIALKPRFFDRQNIKVENFLRKATLGADDDELYARLLKVHEKVVNDFDWQHDGPYYAGIDNRLERMGDFTESEVIREISRYNLYVKYISRLEHDYHTAYLLDARVGALNHNYLSPMWDNDFAFVFPMGPGQSLFLYPKKSRFGYEANEFPFYLEGSRGLVVHLNTLYSGYPGQPRFVSLPRSDESGNVRRTSIDAQVHVESGLVEHRVRLSLGGQFSTLQRGDLMYAHRDSTLPANYFQRIYERDAHVRPTRLELSSRVKEYPYTANFRIDYQHNTLQADGENTFTLPLKKLFNPVVPKLPADDDRTLAYYPDFRFQDAFTTVFTFDEEVKLLEGEDTGYSFAADFGSVTYSAEQTGPREVKVSFEWNLSADMIGATRYEELRQFYAAAARIDQQVLRLATVVQNP